MPAIGLIGRHTVCVFKLVYLPTYLHAGLERLQQLFDALTEQGRVVRTHVYRVLDANDAHVTLGRIDAQRKGVNKQILLDLSTKECELLLEKEVIITRSCSRR